MGGFLDAEAQKTAAADREFRHPGASTDARRGWRLRRLEIRPGDSLDARNFLLAIIPGVYRNDGPEASSLAERADRLAGVFAGGTGGFRRIVQTPGGISSSTTWVRDKGGSATSSWMQAPAPTSIRQWFGTRAAIGRATRW
jgi:hypothetical protein